MIRDSIIRKIEMDAYRANMGVTAGIVRMRIEIQKMEIEARLAMAQAEAQLIAGVLCGTTPYPPSHPIRKITADIKRLSDDGLWYENH